MDKLPYIAIVLICSIVFICYDTKKQNEMYKNLIPIGIEDAFDGKIYKIRNEHGVFIVDDKYHLLISDFCTNHTNQWSSLYDQPHYMVKERDSSKIEICFWEDTFRVFHCKFESAMRWQGKQLKKYKGYQKYPQTTPSSSNGNEH